MAQGQITDPKAALKYMHGGKATVTLVSLSSGNRYTYKIVEAPQQTPNASKTYFVKLLTGADNSNSYSYIGVIRNNKFEWTRKSCVSAEAPSILGMVFVVESLVKNSMRGFEVWHSGKCARCGRKLTVPESIASGFGPECAEMVGAGRVEAAVVAAPTVTGTAAPQRNLNFDGTARQSKASVDARYARIKKFNDSNEDCSTEKFLALAAEEGITVEDLEWFSKRQVNDPDYKVAVAGTPAPLPKPITVPEVDAEIRRRINELQANSPEEYYQDGELDAKQAFNVAYNRFRVQIERENS